MTLRFLCAASIIVFASSCNIHQYMSYSSVLPTNDSGAFYAENDSFNIVYIFQGASIKIELENKTEQLHFVDWSRSSLIFNGQSIPFVSGTSKLEGSGTANQYPAGYANANFEGTITETLTRSYIPPKSRIVREFSGVPINYLKDLKKTHEFEPMIVPSHGKMYLFDETQTLSTIRSYLVIGTAKDTNFKEIEHQFWMSKLIETGEGKLKLKGNQLQVSKQTATGAVTSSIATAVILAASDIEE